MNQRKKAVRFLRKKVNTYFSNKANKIISQKNIIDSSRKVVVETSGICNLNCRICPYRYKKKEKKIVMHTELFNAIISEIAQAEFNCVDLYPTTGEVFLDKEALKKIEILENSSIKNFRIVTNFIPLSSDDIGYLFTLNKLKLLKLSLYGYDQDSFEFFTQKTSKQYTRLLENLKSLHSLLLQHPEFGDKIRIDWWPGKQASNNLNSDLVNIIKNELSPLVSRIKTEFIAENRAGSITVEDVNGLNVQIKNTPPPTEKKGPCVLLFRGSAILPDGLISACGCGDKNNELVIGRVGCTSLKFHRSVQNKQFFTLLNQQEKNIFPGPCTSCSRYESILNFFNRKEYLRFKERIGVEQ